MATDLSNIKSLFNTRGDAFKSAQSLKSYTANVIEAANKVFDLAHRYEDKQTIVSLLEQEAQDVLDYAERNQGISDEIKAEAMNSNRAIVHKMMGLRMITILNKAQGL